QIADQHNALLTHYGWTDRVALCKLPPGRATPEEHLGAPWKWPRVPPLPPGRLISLERAADLLERHVSDYAKRLAGGERGREEEPPRRGRPPADDLAAGYALALLEREGLQWKDIQAACKRRFPDSPLSQISHEAFPRAVSRRGENKRP